MDILSPLLLASLLAASAGLILFFGRLKGGR